MTDLPAAPLEAARHGAYCPKMCTFACPVHTATGREDAVPWTFHVTLTSLAAGRLSGPGAADRTVACTGCLACREPCVFDQDVPAQVRAARRIAPPRPPAAVAALDHVAAGRRPDGTDPVTPPLTSDAAAITVVIGCHDTELTARAAGRLLAAAGLDATLVAAPGCCGQLADDLGAAELAADRVTATGTLLTTATVIGLDPHCLPSLRLARPEADVRDLWSVLVDRLDRLAFTGDPASVTYHDPCLLARGEGVVTAPRQLLAAAGITVVEPEQHGTATGCSGAGLGLPLLDPGAAAATAERRAAQLGATAVRPVTACRRAADQLGISPTLGDAPVDLAVLLADRLAPATP